MQSKTVQKTKKTKSRQVRFSYSAPEAVQVSVVGDFNQWDAQRGLMKKKSNGTWEKTLTLPPGSYEYKFMVDGQWRLDPLNSVECPNSFGTRNNVLVIKAG
jgi:1,4-alpha-glucan branching enzyme